MSRLNKNIPSLLADLAGLGLAYLLIPLLSRQFQDLSFGNSVLMGVFFLLFCLSVFAIKKLRPLSGREIALPAFLFEKNILGALGVLFALSISAATAYVVGFLDSVVAINRGLLDEPSVTIYLLLTPASWFGLALIYMLLLTSDTEATVEPTTARYWLVSLMGLTGVNLMGVVFTAVWQALWARLSGIQGAGYFLFLNLVLYLFLLGPPRLFYLVRNHRLVSVITFLPFILYLAILAAP